MRDAALFAPNKPARHKGGTQTEKKAVGTNALASYRKTNCVRLSFSLWLFVGRAHYHLYAIVRPSFDVSFRVIFSRESRTKHDLLPLYPATTIDPAARCEFFRRDRDRRGRSSTALQMHRLIQSTAACRSIFTRSKDPQGSSAKSRRFIHQNLRGCRALRRMATTFLFHSLGASI